MLASAALKALLQQTLGGIWLGLVGWPRYRVAYPRPSCELLVEACHLLQLPADGLSSALELLKGTAVCSGCMSRILQCPLATALGRAAYFVRHSVCCRRWASVVDGPGCLDAAILLPFLLRSSFSDSLPILLRSVSTTVIPRSIAG